MKPYIFHNLLKALNPDLTWDDLDNAFMRLINQYSESHRAYHTWKHIEEGWKEFDAVRYMFKDPCEAEIAWFFHDYIYVPGNSENEQESADVAALYCTRFNLGEEFKDKVVNFIIKGSLKPQTEDQELFHDIDFSILGQSFQRYCQYATSIKREFSNFPLSERIKFLEKVLQQERIYYTEPFRKKFEKKARSNIAFEINSFK